MRPKTGRKRQMKFRILGTASTIALLSGGWVAAQEAINKDI